MPLDSRSSNDPEHTTEQGHTLQATSQHDQQDEGEHVKSRGRAYKLYNNSDW